MPRISLVLWFVVIVLLIGGFAAGLFALVNIARTAHASDVYRDDVGWAHLALESAGAYDVDKAAGALGLPAYTGGSAAERAEFEQKVAFRTQMFLTDSVADRIEAEWSRTAMQLAIVAAGCIFTAGVVGWQAVRVRRLERAPRGSR